MDHSFAETLSSGSAWAEPQYRPRQTTGYPAGPVGSTETEVGSLAEHLRSRLYRTVQRTCPSDGAHARD
jgi:hypothetical protein